MRAPIDLNLISSLLGHAIDRAVPVAAGGNSRLYRIEGGGRVYALKSYPPTDREGRDRLGVEVGALSFLTGQNVDCVPRVYSMDRDSNIVIMEWIEGDLVGGGATEADIDVAIAFLRRVVELSAAPQAADFPLAAEACLSGAEVLRQIEVRLQRLSCLQGEADLEAFLDRQFRPILQDAVTAAKTAYSAAGRSFAQPLERADQALALADFGFHNMMRTRAGTLKFIDFEYFGWDDPVKLVADFVLHPGTALSEGLRKNLCDGLVRLYGTPDGAFQVRFRALYALYALRWSLILLNEFLPERWERRIFAQPGLNWEQVKRKQLDKALNMLKKSSLVGNGMVT